MGFLKRLFGSSDSNEDEKKKERLRSFDTMKYEAVAALRHGKPQAAIPRLRAALEISDDMECHDYLSQALIMAGELDEAVQETELLASAAPDNASVYVRLAHICYMKEDYDGVATAAQHAVEADPDNALAYLFLARAAHGRGDNVVAVAILGKCIGKNPQMADAYMLRGKLLLAARSLDEADNDACWLIKNLPESEDAMLLKGHIEEARGNSQQAIECYGHAIELNPFCAAAYAARAALRLSLGDKAGAEADMKAMAEASPQNQSADGAEGDSQSIEEAVRQAYRNIDPFAVF